ncbi:hypothetical protein BGW37DRAFT_468379 [Umbelopsis sp. PMI_123]|nr:hypothetical protein BGW37DRAFT_468379 [Umbelopsis sp. PMI_123]
MAFKKRNRSTSITSSIQQDPSKILASKLNKLRSTSLAIFSKLTSSVNATPIETRSTHLRRERSFSFATSDTDHRNLDTLVRDPRLLDRVSRYRSSQISMKLDEQHILTVSNDSSDKKRYDNAMQRAARDVSVKVDRLQVPMSSPHFALQRADLSPDANPEMTVKSEELTAREFADMIGIKIISDDQEDDNYHPIDRVDTRGSVLISDVHHQSSILSGSSIHSAETNAWSIKSKPQIWDSGFWQKPDCCQQQFPIPNQAAPTKIDDKPRPSTTTKGSTSSSEETTSTMLSTLFSCNISSSCASSVDSVPLSCSPGRTSATDAEEPPFISQLRRTSCTSAIKRNDQGGVVIKKGRFHICLGDTQDTQIPTTDEECIKWKRKSMVTTACTDDNTHAYPISSS